jgi:hypothetical protein
MKAFRQIVQGEWSDKRLGTYWHDGEQPSDATASIRAIITKAGQKVLIDVDGGKITIEDGNGNTVTMDSSGLSLAGGNQSVALASSGVNVNQGAFEVTP